MAKMKGVEDLLWVLTFGFVIIFVSIVLVIFYSNPVSGIIDETLRLQAKYTSYQISGIISLTESSDDYISTKLQLPREKGEIIISESKVDVNFGPKNRYSHHFTEFDPLKTRVKMMDYVTDPENPEPVDEKNIVIDTVKFKSIIVQKLDGEIIIKAEKR